MKLNEIRTKAKEEPVPVDTEALWSNPTVENVLAWCKNNPFMKKAHEKQIKINDGRVSFTTDFRMYSHANRLPFKLGTVKTFEVIPHGGPETQLTTTEGFPLVVKGSLNVCKHNIKHIDEFPECKGSFVFFDQNNLESFKNFKPTKDHNTLRGNNLKSFEGCDWPHGSMSIDDNPITSLKGMHKHVKGMGAFEALNCPLKDSLLSLVIIPIVHSGFGVPGERVIRLGNSRDVLDMVGRVLQKYAGQGKAGVLSAQQDLLDMGYDDYAEL